MIFWAGILVAAFFAWFSVKIGFFQIWATLFNLIISTYVAIFLAPLVAEVIPAASETLYGSALTLAAIAIATFLILQGVTYTFIPSQFFVSLPKILNTVGSGIVGFLAGFLVWSFAALLISMTLVSQHTFAQKVGFGRKIEQTNVPYMVWWCNLVNTVAASKDNKQTPEEIINRMLDSAEKKALKKKPEQVEPNKPSRDANKNRRRPSRRAGLEDI